MNEIAGMTAQKHPGQWSGEETGSYSIIVRDLHFVERGMDNLLFRLRPSLWRERGSQSYHRNRLYVAIGHVLSG